MAYLDFQEQGMQGQVWVDMAFLGQNMELKLIPARFSGTQLDFEFSTLRGLQACGASEGRKIKIELNG